MIKTIDHANIRELRLDRPPVNALDPSLVRALTTAVRAAGRDCEAIVLSGREGMFSAGLDVPELIRLDRPSLLAFWKSFFGLLEAVARSPVPVAAAITGHSPAGGAVLSLFCDYRVMVRGPFKIGLNETQVGLVVPGVINRALVRLTGAHRAEQLIMAGALLEPEAALASGMVDMLADDAAGTVQAALDWCDRHLQLPRTAMLGNRALSRADLHAQFDELGDSDHEAFADHWFAEPTQKTLHGLVAQLKGKK